MRGSTPVVSAKLVKDFAMFRDAAEKKCDGLWYFGTYCE